MKKIYLFAFILLSLLTACTTAPETLNSRLNSYEWIPNSPKESYTKLTFQKATFSRLNNLLPQIILTEKNTDGCNSRDPLNYLRREGGMCGVFYWLEDEAKNKIDTMEKFRGKFAPIENEAEAASFIALTISDLKTTEKNELETEFSPVKEGFLIHVIRKNTFGCNMHIPTGELYLVTPAGEIKLVASEPKKEEGSLCVD